MEKLTIGRLAQKSGVNVETVRFYERRGLICQPSKPEKGYRRYPLEMISRIRFIKNAQELGFSLREVSELLDLRVDPQTTCKDVKEQAEAKILDIEEKMQALLNMKNALTKLAATCRGKGPSSECPILEALEHEAGGNDAKR